MILPAYRRRTRRAGALSAGPDLAGTNTRRVCHALAALFGGTVSKDTVRRVGRKVRSDWQAWNRRLLAEEPMARPVVDGIVVRMRLDRKAAANSLLVVVGVCRDGQKTLAAVWPDVTTQRCTVPKHRNLLAHAPDLLHEELSADDTGIIDGVTAAEIEARRKAFARKWRLKRQAVVDSLAEAGERLVTFARLPPGQRRSARTINGINRRWDEFKRRIKAQKVLPSAETAAMLSWTLLASGQITMRTSDGWPTPAEPASGHAVDLAA